ncbi:YbaB/EbfC family nucleoid-associated protein [Mycobacterium sp. Aquia_216]|uniref:YbaB/EbfC family nucleoid-associated protein n=1 Tax=Mycobacterium sp. Aquia_216 TaxID=2991729 RepID=UPI00227AF523|nr:YbaB/EbfC family nucleoid-associated protein [Mycobacterium sp. Aquia_216]WAJ46370.1 YbaB/EbfC family nucleoid-associated protein [Mycobacterium sp. Aquia_216]
MDNDATGHDFAHVLSLVQDQMQELSVMQRKRAALSATATAADGTVQVTVDAQRMVTKTVIDESYLDDYEFTDLGGHITTAAQEAVQEIERQAAALLAPLTERRQEISSLSNLVVDVPEFGDLISGLNPLSSAVPEPRHVDDEDDGIEDGSSYPTVRR